MNSRWKDTKRQRIMRYENILKRSADLYVPLTDRCGAASGKTSVQEMIGHYIMGPSVNSFVRWILADAMKRGRKRLYFLARDGYFMYITAVRYCQKFRLPIECRYLYCSRYSIRIPYYHLNMEEALDYICLGGIDVTLWKILARAGIPEDHRQAYAGSLGMKLNEVISYANLGKVRKLLAENEDFLSEMFRISEDAYVTAAAYLKQEGLLDHTPYAVVDSGWVGSMQKVLDQLLEQIDSEHLAFSGYYWGLYELPEDVCSENYQGYFFSPTAHLMEKVNFNNCVFELLFSAPAGMTTGYVLKDGSYVPVEAQADDGLKSLMKRLEVYLNTYTEKLLLGADHFSDDRSGKNRKTVQQLMKLFTTEPAVCEVRTFGCHKFSDDVTENGAQEIAVAMTDQELMDNHPLIKIAAMLGLIRRPVKESAWYEGSAVRNGNHTNWHLREYTIIKYLRFMRKELKSRKRL